MSLTYRINWNFLHKLKHKPYIVFTPKLLGLDSFYKTQNIDFLLSYNDLPDDKYIHNSSSTPSRLRRYSNYIVDTSNTSEYRITLSEHNIYNQNVKDQRGLPRNFEPIHSPHNNNKWIMDFICQSTALAVLNHNYLNDNCILDNRIKQVSVDLHQIRQFSSDTLSHNAPEGIHKDGADYIISAFIINRSDIIGGHSTIYDNKQNLLFSHTLKNEQGIFQNDTDLYHNVSPIQSKGNHLGFRDIIGLDIKFL